VEKVGSWKEKEQKVQDPDFCERGMKDFSGRESLLLPAVTAAVVVREL
jgi:hypothetical protein